MAFETLRTAVVFDESEPLTKVLGELARVKTAVVITKEGKYQGIIDDRALPHQLVANPASTRAKSVLTKAPVVDKATASIMDVTKLFLTGEYKALPVMEGGEIAGLVTLSDVIRALLEAGMLSHGSADDIMSTPVKTIGEGESLAKAKAEMRDSDLNRLVVVTKSGKLAGVVSTSDLTSLAKPKEHPALRKELSKLDDITVSGFSHQAQTIASGQPIAEASKVMIEKDVSTLIVVSDNRPVGVLTARDIFRKAVYVVEASLVFVSGLDRDDKENAPALYTAGRAFIEKLPTAFAATGLVLHVKKQARHSKGSRHSYEIQARLTGARNFLAATATGWNLPLVVREVLDELRKLVLKGKPNPSHSGPGKKGSG